MKQEEITLLNHIGFLKCHKSCEEKHKYKYGFFDCRCRQAFDVLFDTTCMFYKNNWFDEQEKIKQLDFIFVYNYFCTNVETYFYYSIDNMWADEQGDGYSFVDQTNKWVDCCQLLSVSTFLNEVINLGSNCNPINILREFPSVIENFISLSKNLSLNVCLEDIPDGIPEHHWWWWLPNESNYLKYK